MPISTYPQSIRCSEWESALLRTPFLAQNQEGPPLEVSAQLERPTLSPAGQFPKSRSGVLTLPQFPSCESWDPALDGALQGEPPARGALRHSRANFSVRSRYPSQCRRLREAR